MQGRSLDHYTVLGVTVQSLFRLLTDTQLADYIPVAVRVMRLQVVQQAAALADEHQEPAPRRVILLMSLEMLSQLADAHTQDRNLNFRRTGVGIVGAEALNQVSFRCRCQHSGFSTPLASIPLSSVS